VKENYRSQSLINWTWKDYIEKKKKKKKNHRSNSQYFVLCIESSIYPILFKFLLVRWLVLSCGSIFFNKKYQNKLRPKSIGFVYKERPKIVRPEVVARLKLGSGRLTQVSWVRRGCKTQGTWICAPATPNQLESGVIFQPQVSWVWKGMTDPS